ncbi:MAG TPA: T9SS type A sorting domain-containing protein, partial [Bacteroidia bacterium]|nr:T9SS type A sorting domain-containing protein [Bacteroidia bacterium]
KDHNICKLAPDGNITVMKSGTPLDGPVGLTYDNTGKLYVANFNDRKIHNIHSDSILTYVATMPGPPDGWLGFVTFAKGTLWGTGYNDHRIYRIYQEYVDSTQLYAGSTIGNTDGALNVAKFNSPNGIISSLTGDSLYVSDFNSGRIRIISLLEPNGVNDAERERSKIVVYPNPSYDMITIHYDHLVEKITIHDIGGKLQLTAFEKKINVKGLANGMYFINVHTKNGVINSIFIKNEG